MARKRQQADGGGYMVVSARTAVKGQVPLAPVLETMIRHQILHGLAVDRAMLLLEAVANRDLEPSEDLVVMVVATAAQIAYEHENWDALLQIAIAGAGTVARWPRYLEMHTKYDGRTQTIETPALAPAGWYTDPQNEIAFRYWNGASWTHQVRAAEE